ncbi:MAG: DUF1726 domain-containing protein, partial [Chromatiaceae bacterium]|nr:DUF1726 domain-containing protein [Chromatiaceae bacterium]
METWTRQTKGLSAATETALAELAGVLRTQALTSRHRRALVLAGSPGWTWFAAVAAIPGGSGDRTVWLSERKRPGQCLPLSAGHKLLGSELDVLVYDCHSGFDPDGFGAALGALCGGGLLLLLTPDLERWPNLPDPQATRVAVHPFSGTQVKGRFLRRFAGVLTRSESITLVSESGPIPWPGSAPSEPVAAATGVASPSAACRTPDQVRALRAIL